MKLKTGLPTRRAFARIGRQGLVLSAVMALVTGLFMVQTAAAAPGPGTGTMTLTKASSTPTAEPGQIFTYTLGFTCSSTVTGCTDAVLTDSIPADLEVVTGTTNPVVTGAQTFDIDWDGAGPTAGPASRVLTVSFKDTVLNTGGMVGLAAGTSGTVQVQVRFPSTLTKESDGLSTTNTADLSSSNSPAKSAAATVVLDVETKLAASNTKTWSPASALYAPGTASTITLTGKNDSNIPATSLTILDPANGSNPFNAVDFTGFGALTFPQGADQVQIDAFDGANWVIGAPAATPTLPSGITAGAVQGLRIIFSAAAGTPVLNAFGTAGSIAVTVAQRSVGRNGAALVGGASVANIAQTTVSTPEGDAQAEAVTANYTITPLTATVSAAKSFTPTSIPAGGTSTVRVVTTNTSTGPLSSITVNEPGSGTFFDNSKILLTGWAPGTTYPAGTTSAEFVFNGAAPVIVTPPAAFPTIPVGTTSFSVTFRGTIASGATGNLYFTVATSAAAGPTPGPGAPASITYPNTAGVTGTNAAGTTPTATATANLAVNTPAINVTLTKKATPTTVLPGGRTVIELTAQTPAGTTTVKPTRIVIDEPSTPNSSPFWNAFNIAAIAPTTVPAGSTLTILYTLDGTTFLPLPVVTGPQVYSAALANVLPAGTAAADIVGLRFQFDNAAGFAPSTTVKPNLTFRARGTLRDGSGATNTNEPTYANCGTANASSGALNATPAQACIPGVKILNPTGSGIPIRKDWDLPGAVASRSGNSIGALVTWAAAVPGLASAAISDPASQTTPVTETAYQAFNLTRIDGISPTALTGSVTDPSMRWDSVSKVELYMGDTRDAAGAGAAGAWVDITTTVCAGAITAVGGPCDGKFPGYNLTAAQQAGATGVRLTYIENPYRAQQIAATGDITAPEVGSGIATGTGIGTDVRSLHLIYQLRDTVRVSELGAVGPTTGVETDLVVGERNYHLSDNGQVNNTVLSYGVPKDGSPAISGTWADSVTILDQPLTVTAAKSATPNSLAIPPSGTAPASYPTSVFQINATNTSATRVDQMVITDPISGANPYNAAANVFENLTLTKIGGTLPAGADAAQTVVTITHRSAAGVITTTTHNQADALALTAAQLADVVGVSVTFKGRINSQAVGGLTLTTQLRPTARSTGAAITVAQSPINNHAQARLIDEITLLRPALPTDNTVATADAAVTLTAGAVKVQAAKSYAPTSTTQAAPASPIVVTLQGRSSGTVAPTSLVVADDTETFWNAFTLQSLVGVTLPTGADRVQVEYKTAAGWQPALPAAATAALPAGLDPATVVGLRFTFTRADGAAFIASANAVITLNTVLRTTLRDGSGPVPTTADAPTAMYPNPGSFTNTVVVTGANGDLTDTVSFDTAFTLQSGTSRIAIQKTSVGQSAPGASAPFGLIFQNTGTGNVVNPVVVDTLPADGSLIFDPTTIPDLSTSVGGSLSTNTADVSVVYDAAARTLTFRWPAGSILKPGETYRITLPLQLKPGLSEGQVAINSFSITSDRQFTGCDKYAPASTEPVTLTGNLCATTARITTLKSGGFVSAKGVKGAAGTGAINVDSPATTCTPDADGYFKYPCAAGTVIGGTDNWQLEVTNGGNIPSDRLRLIDILPHPGDTGVVDSGARNSTYTTAFKGAVSMIATGQSANTTMEWFFTTAAPADICTSDLDLPSGASCAAGDWLPSAQLTTQGGTVDPATVTGLKFTFKFDALPGQVLPPGAKIQIRFDTVNTPSTVTGDNRISAAASNVASRAWNSFGVGGSFTEAGQAPIPRDPAEPIKAGVQILTGPIQVTKSVTGAAAPFAPTSFEAKVSCTVAGVPVTLAPGADVVTLAAPSYTARIDGIPVGAFCSVAESGTVGSYGETSRAVSAPVTITVAGPVDPVPATSQVTVTNDYPNTTLTVTKTVQTAATVGNFGSFHVSLACTFGGNNLVYADGRLSFDVVPGTPHSVALPLGATCTIAETTDIAPTSVQIVIDGRTPIDGPSAPIDLDDPTGHTADITNVYGAGTLSVLKTVDGDGGSVYGTGSFTIAIACTYHGQNLYSGTLTVQGGLTVPVPGTFPVGTVCAVEELTNGGANEISVDAPSVTIVDSTDPIVVNVTNTFNTGTVAVEKVREGDGVQNYGAGPFTVQVSCTYDVDGVDTVVALPASGVLVLDADNDYRAVVSDDNGAFGIPQGAVCSVVETGTGGATRVEVTVDGVTVPNDDEAVLEVTNTFDVNDLVISKVREGDGVDIFGAGPFTVSVACTYVADGVVRPIDLGEQSSLELSADNDYAATISGLLVGARCEVAETDNGGATSSAITVTPAVDGTEGVVVIPAQGQAAASVTVTNTFDVADLVINKVRDGEGLAEFGAGPFTVEVSCTYQDEEFDLGDAATQVLSADNDYTVTVTGLPVGAICTVIETDAAGAVRTVITPNDGDVSVGQVEIGVEGAVVEVVNTFNIGQLQIDKIVDQTERAPGENGTYTVRVTNTGQIDAVDLVADDLLPAGAVFVSATGSPVVAGQQLTWTIESLPIGDSIEFTVVATFPSQGQYVNSFGVVNPPSFRDVEVLNQCADVTRSCATVTVVEVLDTSNPPTSPTSPTPPTSTTPTTVVPNPPKKPGLAYTGVDVFGFTVAALSMLLAGAGLMIVGSRRRRDGSHI